MSEAGSGVGLEEARGAGLSIGGVVQGGGGPPERRRQLPAARTCDTEMGVVVDGRCFEIDFEAFDVRDVQEVDAARMEQLDFVLDQPYGAWKAMIEDIKTHGRAQKDYTLNSLDLSSEQEFARGKDYHRRDAFYRFNQTIQEYFDISAQMEDDVRTVVRLTAAASRPRAAVAW